MTNSSDRREYFRQYRQRHKNDEKYKADARARKEKYIQRHPERIIERRAKYGHSQRGLEKSREHGAKYRLLHPDQEKARTARYRKSEIGRKNARKGSLKYSRSEIGREKSRERGARYRQRHPGLEASRTELRRAIIAGAKSEKFTKQEIYERDGGKCHLCGKKCSPRKWHLDHLISLSLGGEHTKKNVAVACPQCNVRKGNRGHSQLRLFG